MACDFGKTIVLQPEHISTYCLTYEEARNFSCATLVANFGRMRMRTRIFRMTMAILEDAGYEHTKFEYAAWFWISS